MSLKCEDSVSLETRQAVGAGSGSSSTDAANSSSIGPAGAASNGDTAADNLEKLQRVTDMLRERMSSSPKCGSGDLDSATPDGRKSHLEQYHPMASSKSPGGRHSPYAAYSSAGHSLPMSSKMTYSNGHLDMENNYAPPMMRHHMSALLGNIKSEKQPTDTPQSQVLRGILQGKERLSTENGGTLEGKVSSDPESSAFKVVRPESQNVKDSDQDRNLQSQSNFDADSMDAESFQSRSPGLSLDDSDPENGFGVLNDPDGSLDMEENSSDFINPGESSDSKKGCAESGVSGMNRMSPPRGGSKRKQYIPQQHDSSRGGATEEEPIPKMQKLEQDLMHHQMKQMKDQLCLMQQRYSQMFHAGLPVPPIHPSFTDFMEKMEASRMGPGEPHLPNPHFTEGRGFMPEGPFRHGNPFLNAMEMDPSHFFKHANKITQDQRAEGPSPSKHHGPKEQSSPLSGNTPDEFKNLAKMLKSEIANSVESLVDSVMSKFMDRQKKQDGKCRGKESTSNCEPLRKSPFSGQNNNNNSLEKEICPKSSSGSNKFSPTSNNNNNNIVPSSGGEKRDSGAATSSSGSTSMPPTPVTSTPKPPRTKVTDKIMHPFFDLHPKPFLDLSRGHPLFPPPPYYQHTQVPPVQPLYAKEPEQTEALALVVNAPKKKRTKVTDTRLSPRAARALLQESVPHQGSADGHKHHHHHHASAPGEHPFNLVPASLPTSVAIPNPSLQHSDILAMYSSGEHNPYAEMMRRHSPSSSPSMANTPTDGFPHPMMKMDADCYPDHSMAEYTLDGIHMISFPIYLNFTHKAR